MLFVLRPNANTIKIDMYHIVRYFVWQSLPQTWNEKGKCMPNGAEEQLDTGSDKLSECSCNQCTEIILDGLSQPLLNNQIYPALASFP